jgi:hypothetical protein
MVTQSKKTVTSQVLLQDKHAKIQKTAHQSNP